MRVRCFVSPLTSLLANPFPLYFRSRSAKTDLTSSRHKLLIMANETEWFDPWDELWDELFERSQSDQTAEEIPTRPEKSKEHRELQTLKARIKSGLTALAQDSKDKFQTLHRQIMMKYALMAKTVDDEMTVYINEKIEVIDRGIDDEIEVLIGKLKARVQALEMRRIGKEFKGIAKEIKRKLDRDNEDTLGDDEER